MAWYGWKWKVWRLAWHRRGGFANVEVAGYCWTRIVGRLMWRVCHAVPKARFQVTDGSQSMTCESFHDHFRLIPTDGSQPWTTVDLSLNGLRKS